MIQVIWALSESNQHYQANVNLLDGELYLRTEAGDFPCRGWREKIILTMNSLLVTASSLLNPSRSRKQDIVSFRPYYLVIDLSNNGIVTLHFRRWYLPIAREILPPVTLPFSDYCRALVESSQAFLETCYAREVGARGELEPWERHIALLKSSLPRDELHDR